MESIKLTVERLFSSSIRQNVIDRIKKEYGEVNEQAINAAFDLAFVYGYANGNADSWNDFIVELSPYLKGTK